MFGGETSGGGPDRVGQELRDGFRPDASGHGRENAGGAADGGRNISVEPLRAGRRHGHMDADVDDHGAFLDVRRADQMFAAGRRHEDIRAAGLLGEAARAAVADGDGGISVDEEQSEGPADQAAAADDDDVFSLDGYAKKIEEMEDALRRARDEPGNAGGQSPEIFGMKAVHVFFGRYPD